jgi:hypothetical protein
MVFLYWKEDARTHSSMEVINTYDSYPLRTPHHTPTSPKQRTCACRSLLPSVTPPLHPQLKPDTTQPPPPSIPYRLRTYGTKTRRPDQAAS